VEDAGFLLGLPTQSLAIRVVLASLVAVPLVRLVLRAGLRTPRARVAASFVPAAALFAVMAMSLQDARLPTVWLPFDGRGMPVRIGDSYLDFAPLAVGVLLVVWVIVAAARCGLRLARVVRARRGVRGLLAHADTPSADVAAVLARVTAALRVPTPDLAVVSGCPGGAAVIGVRRPALIIDARLVERLDMGELEGVLAHEVAHIKRRDNLASLSLGFLRDAFFFVPGGAWALRQLHDEREVAADQRAVEATGRPGALASGLLKVMDTHGHVVGCSALLPMGDRGSLVTRVQLLVEPPSVTTRRRLTETAIVVGSAVLASATGVWVPSTVSNASGIEGLSLVWAPADPVAPATPTLGPVWVGEARAFEVYRATPIQAAPTRGGVHFDSPDEMRAGMLVACGSLDRAVCNDADPVFALGIRPRPTVRLDAGLVAQWRAEQVLSTAVGLRLYVLRSGVQSNAPHGRRLTEDPAPIN